MHTSEYAHHITKIGEYSHQIADLNVPFTPPKCQTSQERAYVMAINELRRQNSLQQERLQQLQTDYQYAMNMMGNHRPVQERIEAERLSSNRWGRFATLSSAVTTAVEIIGVIGTVVLAGATIINAFNGSSTDTSSINRENA